MANSEGSNKIRVHEGLAGVPKPVGPYAAAVSAGGFLFLSGQVPLDPATGTLVEGSIEDQTRQVIRNLQAVLAGTGLTFKNVVKTTIFLVNLADFKAVNEIYGAAMEEHTPARSTIQVAALPLGAQVEIEMIAKE